MWGEIFKKPTKWSVMKVLIYKEIDDLIIGSLGIVAFISFFVGGVVAIQTALNLTNPLIPKYLIGFATRQSVILELGQIELVKIQIDQRHATAREFLEELANKEKDFTQLIFEKYGKSNVDPTSGEIINLD